MAVVKFSKQKIQPNPLEVDYWVDITSNPNGGRIKYHNGENWVDLLNTEGGYVNLYDYYTKTEINKMFERTATVDEIEGKLDEEDVVNVIEDIQFKESDDTIEMVMLKHNDATVSVTMPVASKDQLQSLSSAIHKAIDEIETQYQPKLTAGDNITIDNNVISADIESLDYNKIDNVPNFALQSDLQKEINRATTEEAALGTRITSHVTTVETELDLKADKSNTYTKSQIDAKLSGIYRVKGSCTFESLPTNPTVGDAWNITNDFTLNGEQYPFGTNVVYTENGWDALAGIFDSSELEESINTVDQSLSQEKIRAVKAEQANADNINTEYNRAIAAEEQLQTNIDIVDGKLVNYLPLTGGALSNRLTISADNQFALVINNTTETNTSKYSIIRFKHNSVNAAGIAGKEGDSSLYRINPDSTLITKIWDQDNDGAGSGLDADLLDGKQPSELNVGSATKLQTARTLWGQSFDGTNNVDGDITFDNDKYIMWKSADGSSKLGVFSVSKSNNLYMGYDMATKGYDTYIDGNNIRLRYGTHTTGILLNSSGNVTIGSTDLALTSYRLYVNGDSNINGNLNVSKQIKSTVSAGTAPISVSSSTMCPNLNANYLGGYTINDVIDALQPKKFDFTSSTIAYSDDWTSAFEKYIMYYQYGIADTKLPITPNIFIKIKRNPENTITTLVKVTRIAGSGATISANGVDYPTEYKVVGEAYEKTYEDENGFIHTNRNNHSYKHHVVVYIYTTQTYIPNYKVTIDAYEYVPETGIN